MTNDEVLQIGIVSGQVKGLPEAHMLLNRSYISTYCEYKNEVFIMIKEIALTKKHYHFIFFILGFVGSVVLMLPYIILQGDAIIPYHDQLDGELIGYLLSAKYLFTGTEIYPELLNGLPNTGAVVPAVLFVFIYKIFSPLVAFLVSQWIITFVAFTGMYLLVNKLIERPIVSFLTGLVFMLLPFYPVYGLCIPGQPLLLYSVICLYREIKIRKKLVYISLILIYSLSSSLILVGFAYLFLLGLYASIKTIRNLCNRTPLPFSLWIAFLTLTVGYFVSNYSLILQVIFPKENMTSHKSEIIYKGISFVDSLWNSLYPGVSYTETWYIALPFLFIFISIFWILNIVKKNQYDANLIAQNIKHAFWYVLIAFFCAFFNALYNSTNLVNMRNALDGAIKGFNLGRIVWLMPTAWILSAAYLINGITLEKKHVIYKRCSLYVRYLFVFFILAIWSLVIFLNSPIKANVSKIMKGDNYYALDWDKFFAPNIFQQIEEAIGLPKESYKVISLGIYPAAATYNGFYCLDGYSNNYPLTYKHEFRQIFSGELDKNSFIREYFDNWGNRCYITTAEYCNYYSIERKWNGGFHDLAINTNKLKELGCKYIFAATWILNADELGLECIQEEPFVSEQSWYNIYVYEIL